MTKNHDKNLNILRRKRAFKMKYAFFIIFKGLSMKQITQSFKINYSQVVFVVILHPRVFLVHNLLLKIGFCQMWQKSVVITVKSHKKFRKNHIFLKKSELTTNDCHFSKGELFLYICGKNCIEDVNVLSTSAP